MLTLNKTIRRRNHLLTTSACLALLLLLSAIMIMITGRARAQEQSRQPAGKFLKSQGANAVRDQYLVMLRDHIPESEVARIAAELARRHGGVTRRIYVHSPKGFSVNMPEAAALALSRDPRIDLVEEDGWVHLSATQYYPRWGLDRIDQRNLPLTNSYTYGNAGENVHVYVIDTGIRITHQEFWPYRATQDLDLAGDNNGLDCIGHGTRVAGIIGGSTYGVAKNVNLHSIRVMGCSGITSYETLRDAVDWVRDHHVKPAVVNLSLFGYPGNQMLDQAVKVLIAQGVTFVTSAGNGINGTTNEPAINAGDTSPGRVEEAITVSATDEWDNKPSWANYGSVVDVFAPGTNILSATWDSDTATMYHSGVSYATPHVAGLAALYLDTHQTATPAEVAGVIRYTATKNVVGNPGSGSPNRLLFSNFPNWYGTTALFRYWNPSLGDHFYTINFNFLKDGNYGWGIERIAGFTYNPQLPATVPLYRYWNPSSGDHFYTTNFNELGNGAQGYAFENIEGYVVGQQQAGTVPLYRYWNPTIGDHYYTTNFNELGYGANGYTFEGTQCYVLPLN